MLQVMLYLADNECTQNFVIYSSSAVVMKVMKSKYYKNQPIAQFVTHCCIKLKH
jgi:hypothetical protein